ncbi:hypothetical protein BKA56DRAFT_500961 [Ilyonectria sp. MPI-CAGE-AT-0026]|nr:hypothetical protein BKA56DRAFT_500961 [Ilyonectria sp. MPI-CAGE-AT-0026]
MPYRLDAHVLVVHANVIHKVDTGNPTNLISMWTDSVEQGRRLENRIWRLWQRETFDCQSASNSIPLPIRPKNILSESRISGLPELSGSVGSLTDEEADDITTVPIPLDSCYPRIRVHDSRTCRSKPEGHISSDYFERMVVSILKDESSLLAPPHSCLVVAPLKESLPAPDAFERSCSTTTEPQSSSKSISDRSEAPTEPPPIKNSGTIVVRGFWSTQAPVSQSITTAQFASSDRIPEPTSSPAPKPVQSKKRPTKFSLGSASFSSTKQDQCFDNHRPVIPIVKKSMFQIGESSENDASLKSALASSRPSSLLSPQKKQASFSTNIMTRTIEDEAAVDSDTDYIDESAIDDDDDDWSDWEDSIEDSGKSSMDDKFFQRVDSKPNLTSRRSLITLMLAKYDRERNLGNHASQSTSAIPRSRMAPNEPSLGASPNESDEAPWMIKGMRHPTLKPIHKIPSQPIVSHAGHVHGQAALSPRTTRRNMLATELTESLRRHLLWERQQKSLTANAILKRRHTSHDVTNLRQYPEKPCIKTSEDVNARRYNEVFSKEASNRYHSQGW